MRRDRSNSRFLLHGTRYPAAILASDSLRCAPIGRAYTYHGIQNEAALRALETIYADPRFRHLAARKDREHVVMTDIARDPDRMLAFLNGAPDGFDQATLVRTCRL